MLAGLRSRPAPALTLAPASPVAETAVVAAILMKPDELPAVARLVQPWMLRDPQLRELYVWQLGGGRAGKACDIDALEAAATEPGSWVGDRLEHYRRLMEEVPNPAHATAYAETVRLLRPGLRGALERWMLLNW
jgi:hypothetical protein